jgi:hypothetical protein
MEVKKLVAGGVLSVGLGIGGFLLAHGGFSEVGAVGHVEACQDASKRADPDCNGTPLVSAESLGAETGLVKTEAWTGAILTAVGALGMLVTVSRALAVPEQSPSDSR